MPKCGKCHVKTKLNIQLKKHTCSIKTSVIRTVAEQPTDNKSPKKVILEKRESHQFTRGKPKETIVDGLNLNIFASLPNPGIMRLNTTQQKIK